MRAFPASIRLSEVLVAEVVPTLRRRVLRFGFGAKLDSNALADGEVAGHAEKAHVGVTNAVRSNRCEFRRVQLNTFPPSGTLPRLIVAESSIKR